MPAHQECPSVCLYECVCLSRLSVFTQTKSAERALLMVFNPGGQAVNTTLQVPLYYSGLSTVSCLAAGGGVLRG
jgi:hypothetical protein